MSELKKYKLGDIAQIIGGGTPSTTKEEYWNGEIGWLTPRDLTGYSFKYISKGERNITEEGLKNSSARLMPKGTVLMTSRAPIGYLAVTGDKLCTNQGFKSFIVDEDKINNEYLYYLLRCNIDRIKSLGTGSTFAEVSASILKSFEIEIPDLPNQRQIAQILSSLDDKIELNLQMNQTLEAMAQAIFKEWFVNFNFPGFNGELVDGLPKGWRKITLDEIAKVKNGFAFKGTDFINEGIPVIKIKNVKPNKILLNDLSYVSREVAEKAIKYLINQNDILITMSGNRMNGTPDTWVGKVALFQRQGEYLLNQRVSVIDLTPDYSHLKYYLTILLSSIEFQNYFISSATSSGGQANISPALIYSTEIILPDLETSQKFYLTIKSFYDKILENELQIESLTQTRDTLIPKLMSGQLEVV